MKNDLKRKSLFYALRKLALHNIEKPLDSPGVVLAFLKRWWCRRYNRPYKDPLLKEYRMEELLIEFYETLFLDDKSEKEEAKKEMLLDMIDPDEEEAELKEIMGDDYVSPEEMSEVLKGVKGVNSPK